MPSSPRRSSSALARRWRRSWADAAEPGRRRGRGPRSLDGRGDRRPRASERTEFTRPATWEDVKRIAGYLNEAGAEYALIGGYAIGVHGFSGFTEDVDILIERSRENGARWILALSRLPDGAARELVAEPGVFESASRYAIRINDEVTVDVLTSAACRGTRCGRTSRWSRSTTSPSEC